ncbi:MAG: sigma factor-like helix-turn-helix DNA-binding protein [Tepidisphaeraceae bacterium]|jgi:DNA-directed RNA polymerase specialized sigma24 family protein
MTLDANLVDAARRGNPDAIHEVLARLYPAVARMALALAGRDDVARGIIAFVMRQGTRRFDKWTDADAPWRWFYHHTLLTSRRSGKHAASAAQEVLAPHPADDPAFIAFVRAVRLLPEQQREVVILCHGEQLSERSLAIAMDCSTSAAAAHLRAAEASLAKIAGPSLPDLLTRLHAAYMQLTPSDDIIAPAVRQWVEKALRPRRTRRLLRLAIGLALTAAAAWLAIHFGIIR